MVKNTSNYKTAFGVLLVFLAYTILTVIIFKHRITQITTHYGLPDVDTDGTFWYLWNSSQNQINKTPFNPNVYLTYPYGFETSYIPFESLIYDIIISILKIIGPTIQNIIFVTNISTILSYPIAGLCMYLLSYYITKRELPSFVAGLIFSFSYYHVLMGRGSLSLNHTFFIPLYYLFILRYLENKKVGDAIITGLIIGLAFKANAYWAFFSVLISIPPSLYFILQKQKRILIKEALVLLFSILAFLIPLNFSFIKKQLYNFDRNLRKTAGREVNLSAELVPTILLLKPSSVLYSAGTKSDLYLGYVPIFLGFMYITSRLHKSNPRLKGFYYFSLLGFVVSLALQTKVATNAWLNNIYFQLFGAFRAVSRINVLSSMFLAVMASINLTTIIERDKRVPSYVAMMLISVLVIMDGLNRDRSWRKMGSIIGLNEHYSFIRDDSRIESLAVYPMHLSNGDTGFPRNYQLLAQIVHQKKVVGGLSAFQKGAREYHEKIKNPLSTLAINTLENAGVDAIMIYYERTGNRVTYFLKRNEKLTYAGRFVNKYDESISYDLFYINKNYFSANTN